MDAAKLLAKFMVNGLPDKDLFIENVGSLIEKADRARTPIRAYGEMVALLWKQGNKDGVIQLESLWNELAETYSFSLFCAYPKLHFIMDTDVRHEINSRHEQALALPVY